MKKYRASVIGLGWMGMLYDLAPRSKKRFHIDDVNRPTPTLDIHRHTHHRIRPNREGNPTSYCDALHNCPKVELISAADRDPKRLKIFTQRYGIDATYTNAEQMLKELKPEIVAVATNTKHRADLTCLAVECGAKAIMTEKPMAHTLEEVDRMVKTCSEACVPLSCGSISTTHASFEIAKRLLSNGHIGKLLSIETGNVFAQHQNWSYFLDKLPEWVVGIGDENRRESGSNEFVGQGFAWSNDFAVHFRKGSSGVRITGDTGELVFDFENGWRLWKDVQTDNNTQGRAQLPWPKPNFNVPYGAVYCLDDLLRCLAGELDEPKNSGRRVGIAIEVELALKESSTQGGTRIDLPLQNRGLGLHYDWFR